MLHFCSRLNYTFATTQRYSIKKLNYLIDVPPTRPASGFSLYVKKKASGVKGNATKNMKSIAESWNSLSEAQKSQYSVSSSKADYEKERDAYISNFVTPFKRISGLNLFMSHLYTDKVVSMPKGGKATEMGKIVGEKIKNAPQKEMEKYKKEAQKISSERSKELEKYKFPTRKYHSQTGFTRDHPKLYIEERGRAYEKYVIQWEFDVEDWLKKNNVQLTLSEFKRMYNRELKKTREKRPKEAKEEESSEKPTKVAKTAKATKAAKSTRSAKRTKSGKSGKSAKVVSAAKQEK